MKVKVEHEKTGLKLNIQKTKIMTSGPITSWQTDGETMENNGRLFLGLQNLELHHIMSLEIKLSSCSLSPSLYFEEIGYPVCS